jgi:HPt (histidine-containing phosphotransfer) domain-containing protein
MRRSGQPKGKKGKHVFFIGSFYMKKINAREVLEQFDNDTELFKTVVDQFNEELPRYVKQLSEACEKKNWKEVHQLAHKIHGAAANFLENPVRELSKQMEVLAQRNQTGGLQELSKHLETHSKELLTHLKKMKTTKAA